MNVTNTKIRGQYNISLLQYACNTQYIILSAGYLSEYNRSSIYTYILTYLNIFLKIDRLKNFPYDIH